MGSKREVGGVVLAFGGFVFLVMAVKGTWGNVWGALLGHPTRGASSSSAGSSGARVAPGFPGAAPLPSGSPFAPGGAYQPAIPGVLAPPGGGAPATPFPGR